jgi:hypothetical protein
MTGTRIIRTRPAGRHHQVLSIEGGGHSYRREPCATCPWRKDAVGEFPAEAFLHSADTGTDGAHFNSDAMHTFACHESGSERPATCAGYILRGADAISWRIARAFGKFDPSKVLHDTGVALFDNYYDMAVANGVSSDNPKILKCKPYAESHATDLSRAEGKDAP